MVVYAIYCGGFQGSSYYARFDEAEQAANFRTYATGHKWSVRSIVIPKD